MKLVLALLPLVVFSKPANGNWITNLFSSTICDGLCRCPDDFSEARTQGLDCRDNNITSLPDDLNIPSAITKIDFTRNAIINISKEVFRSSSMLTAIDFSDNYIQYLQEDLFQYTPGLKELVFKNNKLYAIHEKAFAGLTNLTKLDLSYNQLQHLPSLLFTELPSLEKLILDFNPLTDVSGISLSLNPSLHTLHLSSIWIRSLHPDFLSWNLTKLSTLKLAFNHLMEIPSKTLFHISNSLTDLDLSGNPIKTLGAYSFYGLKNLRNLRLDQMLKLESIDAFAFGDLTHLETITLRYMPKINNLDAKAFYGNKNGSSASIMVEDFTFSFSILSTLPEGLLNWDKLRLVNLQYNHWNCDCNMQWVKNSTLMEVVGKHMVCSTPLRLRGHKIIDILAKDMNCLPEPVSHDAPIGFVFGLIIAGIGVSLGTVALLVYWRQGWLFRRPPGQYTHIERGPSEITVTDDMEWDNKDLQKD